MSSALSTEEVSVKQLVHLPAAEEKPVGIAARDGGEVVLMSPQSRIESLGILADTEWELERGDRLEVRLKWIVSVPETFGVGPVAATGAGNTDVVAGELAPAPSVLE